MARSIDADDRILVTGSNGFIGTALVEQLLDTGAPVFAGVRHERDRLTSLPPKDRLVVTGIDLSDREQVRRALEEIRPTIAFHLAWLTEPDAYLTSIPWNLESVRMGLSLVEDLLDVGCERMVFAGTCAEYELGPDVLSEDSPTRPGSVYGASKLALGTVAAAAARQGGASLAWARIFYVYGPREDARRALPRMVSGARSGRPPELGKPAQRRDFLHVHDVAAGLLALGRAGAHGPFNVCSGGGVALTELWRRVQALVDADGSPVTLVGDVHGVEPPIIGDPSRLRDLGWRPRFGDDDGLADAVRWLLDHRP
jgi:nucleoside-diphosphate-sugar epimerase